MNYAHFIGAALRAVDLCLKSCPACGERPLLMSDQFQASPGLMFWASCHGSTDSYAISAKALNDPDRAIGGLMIWMRGLFKLDAIPDMIELLAYNRGRLPGARA